MSTLVALSPHPLTPQYTTHNKTVVLLTCPPCAQVNGEPHHLTAPPPLTLHFPPRAMIDLTGYDCGAATFPWC